MIEQLRADFYRLMNDRKYHEAAEFLSYNPDIVGPMTVSELKGINDTFVEHGVARLDIVGLAKVLLVGVFGDGHTPFTLLG